MLGKGRYAIVREWKNDAYGDGIQVIEYCETIEEGKEYIREQKKYIENLKLFASNITDKSNEIQFDDGWDD